MGALLETEIPMPGLATSGSQVAVPISAHGQVLGVLYAESEQERRFSYDDEDVLLYRDGYSPLWSSNFATRPVQPVWWLAPRPAPLSPWKYS